MLSKSSAKPKSSLKNKTLDKVELEGDFRSFHDPYLNSQPSKNTICLSPNRKDKGFRLESTDNPGSTNKSPSRQEATEGLLEPAEQRMNKKDSLVVHLGIDDGLHSKSSQLPLETGSIYNLAAKPIGSGIDTTKDPGTFFDPHVHGC
jgi:hypothetical protein